jgi:putative Holliday junction resolvase
VIEEQSGRIAGIDFGTVRIGIALADAERTLASPFATYVRRGEAADRGYFRRLVADEHVGQFVVGLPVHLDGRESAKSAEARRFGAWLAGATGIDVQFFDERFTTHEAQLHLAEAKLSKKKRQARLDKLAAQIMLAAYLEVSRADARRLAEPPRGLDDNTRRG